MEIIFTVITLVLIRKYRQKLATLKINIDKFGIENQILTMTVGTFIALEVIIIISELKLVASSILGVMIVIFTLITSLITYQMIFFIKSYFIRQEAANIRKQNSQLNNYMENIEQQYTEFKKFKHDYNNLLLSLKTLIDGNDSDQLKSYYEELKQQSIVQQTNDAQMMVATDKIDNEPVRGLLIQKFFAAQKLDIKFSIETPETAIKLTNHVVPIVRILGILLDNAIEYVHCHPQYAQAVTCAFINHEHSIELIIENPTSELIDLDQIFELGYSTKGSDHGFGLSNVSELVRQIPNLFINTELKDEKIQISLVLQKEAPFVSHLLT
jgi:two-component system sensor histidine kinase AgrC